VHSLKRRKLCFVYHTPFWFENGKIATSHAAVGKYVESLSPFFQKIYLGVPNPGEGDKTQYILESDNFELLHLPHYHNNIGFWLHAPKIYMEFFLSADHWDILHIRLPSHIAFPAYLAAKMQKKHDFNVIVGEFYDYNRMAGYPYLKQKLVNFDSRLQDFLTSIIVRGSLNFTNGEELYHKYKQLNRDVRLMRSSTINRRDIIEVPIMPEHHHPIKIITVAVISPRKGISLIPEIIHHLIQMGVNLHWDIFGKTEGVAGQNEYRKTLSLAKNLGVSKFLKFHGEKPWEELKATYRKSDIFVLPTYAEGVPRVLLEAQAAGLPVVTTSVGGIPSAICNNKNGLLVPPGKPEKMAKEIYKLIQDKDLYQELVMNGIQTAKEHSLESETKKMLEQVNEFYSF